MDESAWILEPGRERERLAEERDSLRGVTREQAPDARNGVDAEALVGIVGSQEGLRASAHLDDLGGVSGVRCRLACFDQHLRRLRGSHGRDLGRAAGERDEGVRRNAAPELDRAAEMHDVGAHERVGDEARRPGDESERVLRATREPCVLRSSNEPAAASLAVTRELGRTLERTRGSGEAAPLPRTLGRELQFLRDVVVLADGGGGTVPGPPVRVLLSMEYLGQHPVHVAALP